MMLLALGLSPLSKAFSMARARSDACLCCLAATINTASGYGIPKPVETPAKNDLWDQVQQFKDDLDWSHWISGTVPVAPKLRANGILFAPPYDNAKELYESARPSKVGVGSETVTDTWVRKSKEFDSKKIGLLNNEIWKQQLEEVCAQVKTKLAPGATAVTAELHKMVLYRQGDYFRPHRDAQQSDREFASLVFSLPTKFAGGRFELKRHDCDMHVDRIRSANYWETVEHESTGGNHCSACTWVAFYTDHEHRVTEVEGGHRIVLTYKLCFDGSLCPSSALPTFPDPLRKTFLSYFRSLYLNNNNKVCGMAIPLLFQYTERTMFPSCLKGVDALLFNALEAIGLQAELMHTMRMDKTWYIEDMVDNPALELDAESYCEDVYLVDEEVLGKVRKMMEGAYALDECAKSKLLDLVATGTHRVSQLDWFCRSDFPIVDFDPMSPISSGSSPFFKGLSSDDESTPWLGNYGVPMEFYYLDLSIVVLCDKVHDAGRMET